MLNNLFSDNEINAITFLFRNYKGQYSINELARSLNIYPNSMHKILAKFENDGIIVKHKVANAMIYNLNFHNEKTEDVVKYALKSRNMPNKYAKAIIKDLQEIKLHAKAIILFGSVLTKGQKANDIDIMIVVSKSNRTKLDSEIQKYQVSTLKKIHAIGLTPEDLENNLKEKNKGIVEILNAGFIIGGFDYIYGQIKKDAN